MDQLASDNDIEDADKIGVGQRVKLGDYNDAGRARHGALLKHGYMFGNVSWNACTAQGFNPWAMMNNEERAYVAQYYKTIKLLYDSGAITKEQYMKEMIRLEGLQDGKLTQGALYDAAFGNVEYKDEPFLFAIGGVVVIRAIQVFGPAIASSELVQRLLNKGREVEIELGRKLDYLFGKATGSIHNIQRSLDMLRQMQRIGLPDTEANRAFMQQFLQKVFSDPTNVARIETSGRIVKEAILAGPNGVVKLETI